MKLKKIAICIALCIIILIQCMPIAKAADTSSLNIYSHAALLIDMNTGKVLYDKNSTERLYPASITKIMTAILAIENTDLNSIAKVSYNAVMSVPIGYSTANLQLDEELTVENLLYVLMIPSACDAAVVLAEHVSLSEENFVSLMNKKALELGCTDTNFTNTSGVHDDNHYSNAKDLALITEHAMKNPIFRTIVSTTTYTLPSTNKYPNRDRVFNTTNYLIRLDNSSREDNYYYKYAIGVKTGMTDEAGETLSTVASKDGQEFLAILLKSGYTENDLSQRFLDATTLFNFAFNTYTQRTIVNQGDVLKQVEIKKATAKTKKMNLIVDNTITVLIEKINIDSEVDTVVTLKEDLQAPIKKGDIVGTLTYNVEGLSYTTNLLAGSDVVKSNVLIPLLIGITIIIVLLFGIRFFNLYIRKGKKKKYNKKVIHVTNIK